MVHFTVRPVVKAEIKFETQPQLLILYDIYLENKYKLKKNVWDTYQSLSFLTVFVKSILLVKKNFKFSHTFQKWVTFLPGDLMSSIEEQGRQKI